MFSEAFAYPPPDRDPPLDIDPLQTDTLPLWTQTPPPPVLTSTAATAAVSTHPTGMHSC